MLAATRMRLPPGVNFAALPSRLISTCLRLRWASSKAGSGSGTVQSSVCQTLPEQDLKRFREQTDEVLRIKPDDPWNVVAGKAKSLRD